MFQIFIFYFIFDVGVLYIVRTSTIYHGTSCTTISYEKWLWMDVFGMKMFHLLQIHSKSASALTISFPFWNILFIADISTYSRWCCHATISISFNVFFFIELSSHEFFMTDENFSEIRCNHVFPYLLRTPMYLLLISNDRCLFVNDLFKNF